MTLMENGRQRHSHAHRGVVLPLGNGIPAHRQNGAKHLRVVQASKTHRCITKQGRQGGRNRHIFRKRVVCVTQLHNTKTNACTQLHHVTAHEATPVAYHSLTMCGLSVHKDGVR